MNKNYIFDNVRISLLENDIVRFECVPSKNFSNEETIFTSKKKENDFKLEIKEENGKHSFDYQGFAFSIDENRPLDTLEVYKDNKRVFKYKGLSNTGELPLPNKTPIIFPLIDSPRLILPRNGYDEESKFLYEKDTRDLFLLICNNDYRTLRKQYISLTGHNEMMRLKNFGLFSSRYFAYSEKTAKEMILKYKKHRIPLDNFVLDTDWRIQESTPGTGYQINKDLFPNLSKFFHFAHQQNVEVIMNDHPNPLSKKLNVFSPEEIEFRKSNLLKFFYLGLDSWWYDRNWCCSLKGISKRIPVESLGRYIYHDISRDFYQSLVLDPEIYVRPVTLSNITEIKNGKYENILDSRSHTYPFQWSGDIDVDSHTLYQEINNMNRCSNNMLTYYSSDIGGHIGNPTKVDFVRWYQFGAFSPIFRPHCTVAVNRYREPWVFKDKTESIVKEYIYMRYRLLNLYYTEAYKHYSDGLGIFRPLYLNYPNDKKVYKENSSYMLGDKLLISPICSEIDNKLNKSNFVGSVYVSSYDNDSFKGKVKLSRLSSLNVEKLLANKSIRLKGTIKLNKDGELFLCTKGKAKVFLNDKVVALDETLSGSPRHIYISSLKKNVNYKVVVEVSSPMDTPIELRYERSVKNAKKKIYLPEGEWYNLSHRNVYQGRRYIKEKYKLHEMPLFMKAGTLLMLYKNVDNLSTMNLRNVVYDFYPSRKVTTDDYFYEDDGVTTGYRVGVNRISRYRLEYKDNYYLITLFKSEEGLFDQTEFRNALFKMHVRDKERIAQVLVDDQPVKFRGHDHSKKVYPFSNNEFASDSKTIAFKFRQDIRKDLQIKIFVKQGE